MSMQMKTDAALLSKVGIGALAALMLMGGLCRKTVGTTIQVVNATDGPIRNVEVNYSGGTIGVALIQPGATFKQWVPAKGDCSVKFAFQTATDKSVQPTAISTKTQCPMLVMFTVNPDLKITSNLR